MFKSILGWLRPPHYDDPDQQRRATYVNAIILCTVGMVLLIVPLRGIAGILSAQNRLLLGLCVLLLALRSLLSRGFLTLVSEILVISMVLGLTYLAWAADGIRDVTFLASIIAVLAAALLIGWQAAALVLGFSILAGWGMALAESSGLRHPTLDTATNFARDYSAVLVLVGLLIYLYQRSLTSAAVEARAAEHEAKLINEELQALQTQLAERVEERTAELHSANAVNTRRVQQLQSVSEVASAIARLQNIDEMLTQVAGLVGTHFGYYHVGIFLIDEKAQFVELCAANSDGGARMLLRHHRLSMGGNGIVAAVASSGQPRIALDVGQDAQFLRNPDLPETRSEMSLPLRVGDKIIGVFDVQSTQAQAFSEDDISVLSTLADQVAVAIENAHLFSETRRALAEADSAYQGFLRQEWTRFSQRLELVGLRAEGSTTTPIYAGDEPVSRESALVLPIMLHGEVVGELSIGSQSETQVRSEDQISVLRAAADRLATAFENARLVQASQERALQERALSDMTAEIGATADLDAIMQTAVQQVGKIIGGTEVIIQLNNSEAGPTLIRSSI